MNTCPQCGSHNRPGILVCQQCSANMFDHSYGSTQVVEQEDQYPHVTRPLHNTDTLVRERQITLEVMGEAAIQTEIDREMVLGRTNIYSAHLPDIDLTRFHAFDLGVSCRHAEMVCINDRLQITDLGSTNGTYLNGERLIPQQPYIVRDRDTLRLAQLFLRVRFDAGSNPVGSL